MHVPALCSGPFRLLQQNTTGWLAYKQQKAGEFHDQVPRWVQSLLKASSLAHRLLLPLPPMSSHITEEGGLLSGAFGVLTSFVRAVFMISLFSEVLSPNTNILRIRHPTLFKVNWHSHLGRILPLRETRYWTSSERPHLHLHARTQNKSSSFLILIGCLLSLHGNRALGCLILHWALGA